MTAASDEENIDLSHCQNRLLFDEEDSSSDISQSNGPRRRCSFVSVGSSNPVMDLRYPNSVHASDKSYDLSISSDASLNTMQTNNDDLEKMGMFEVALSAAFQREGEGVLKRANSNPGTLPKEGLLHKLRLKRHTLEHGGMCNKSPVRLTGSNKEDDSSVVKKNSKTPQESTRILRRFRAVAFLSLLSVVIAAIVFIEASSIDPSLIIAKLSTALEARKVFENIFSSKTEQEEEPAVQLEREQRVMVRQPQAMIPDDNGNTSQEFDKVFIQAFRNNQKIVQRLNRDSERQLMMAKRGDENVDERPLVLTNALTENEVLAQEVGDIRQDRKLSKVEDLDLTMKWFLQVKYQPHRDYDHVGVPRQK